MGDDLQFLVVEDQEVTRPLIPSGIYEVEYTGHDLQPFMGGHKIYTKFKIVSFGPYLGVVLFRAYNFYGPKLPPGSDLYKDLVLLYGHKVRKNAKLSMSLFKNKILEVRVREVKRNRNQIEFAEHQKYSVVDAIRRVVIGGAGA